VASVAWPCWLHESVVTGGTPPFMPGLTNNAEQVKVEDREKQSGGQAGTSHDDCSCLFLHTILFVVFYKFVPQLSSGRLHCTRRNRFTRHLQLSDTQFSAFHTIDALWLLWPSLYGFDVQSKELGEWDMPNYKSHRPHRGLLNQLAKVC